MDMENKEIKEVKEVREPREAGKEAGFHHHRFLADASPACGIPGRPCDRLRRIKNPPVRWDRGFFLEINPFPPFLPSVRCGGPGNGGWQTDRRYRRCRSDCSSSHRG